VRGGDVAAVYVLPEGVIVAVNLVAFCVTGFQAHVAVIVPEVTVETARQFGIRLPLAKKRTLPAVFTVTTTLELLPLLIDPEILLIATVAGPGVITRVIEVVPVPPPASVAVTVKSVELKRAVGAPISCPVLEFSVTPPGRDGEIE
jgi:hypothetical protein